MSSQNGSLCKPEDILCVVTVYEQEVIIVPVLLLLSFLLILLAICVLRYCPNRSKTKISNTNHISHHNGHTKRHRHRPRPNLQGIDAPPELNPLEHEALSMTTQTHLSVQPVGLAPAVPETTMGSQHGAYDRVTPLQPSIRMPDDKVTLYRARTDNRNVVLKVLKEAADSREQQHFLGFASFLSELGPHPFLPGLMGVVSLQPPMVILMEELEHRDLLGFLWRCRQDNADGESPCDLTEKRIFIMGGQVASALEYLHSQRCIHGNVGARSVLVGRDLTAKLWGLGPAYRRIKHAGFPGELADVEMRKWHAPEVLATRAVSHSSDVWSFGILLQEMVTLGDPPFPQIMASELLQYLQRGKAPKRPAICSNSLYSLIKSCCQWNPQSRPSLADLRKKLQSGEKQANDRTVLRVPERLDFEKYLREAGYGEAYNYAVL